MSTSFWIGLAVAVALVGLVWWGADQVAQALDRSDVDGAED